VTAPTTAIIGAFGPIGFGLVAVIILWRVIVQPELRAVREGAAAMCRGIDCAKDAAASSRAAASEARLAAQILTGALAGSGGGTR